MRKTAIAHAHGAKNSHGWWGRWDLTPQFVGLLTPPRACIRAQITYTTKLTQLNETMNAFRSSRISFDEVLRLYRAILRETGGEYGFVSEGTLRYILDSMDSIRGDIFAKAAYAIHGIATKHPLVNGNKRLAFALGALILRTEGIELLIDKDETVPLMLRAAKGELPRKALESWLRSKSRKIQSRK